MEKIIAVLPCSNADAQIEFYSHMGFALAGKYPRSYLVFRYGDLEFHFYGTKMYLPNENPSMCLIQTDNLQRLYDVFTSGVKKNIGKVPRTGFPKITKIRELSEDWRFTIADPSGNTIYVLERKPEGSGTFFRDISNEQYAGKFAILYDLVYSKQDMESAHKVLDKLLEAKGMFHDLDKAKLLIIQLEIYKDADTSAITSELELLISNNQGTDEWKCVSDRLLEMKYE